MNYRYILYAYMLFILGQCLVWFQLNGPLLWQWARDYRGWLLIMGIPITWIFMRSTELVVQGFGGAFWPGRFMSFTAGIVVFTILTYIFKSEGINAKTAISLILAFALIAVQLFWKS